MSKIVDAFKMPALDRSTVPESKAFLGSYLRTNSSTYNRGRTAHKESMNPLSSYKKWNLA